MLAVAAKSQEIGNNELRSPALSRFSDGLGYHIERSKQVRAVDLVTRNPIANGTIDQGAASELPIGRC